MLPFRSPCARSSPANQIAAVLSERKAAAKAEAAAKAKAEADKKAKERLKKLVNHKISSVKKISKKVNMSLSTATRELKAMGVQNIKRKNNGE